MGVDPSSAAIYTWTPDTPAAGVNPAAAPQEEPDSSAEQPSAPEAPAKPEPIAEPEPTEPEAPNQPDAPAGPAENISYTQASVSLNGWNNDGFSGTFKLSPDGSLVSAADMESNIQLWNTADGALLHTIDAEEELYTMAFSSDGQSLATTTGDGRVLLWSVADGTLLSTLEPTVSEGHFGFSNMAAVAVSPDGQLVAGDQFGSAINIWQVSDGALLLTIETDVTGGLTFSPDGQLLAASRWSDDAILVWNVSDGSVQHEVEGGTEAFTFSSDSQTLLAMADNGVAAWQISDGTPLEMNSMDIFGNADGITVSPDGQLLASANFFATIIWRMNDGTELLSSDQSLDDIVFAADGRTLIGVDASDGIIHTWTPDGAVAGVEESPAPEAPAPADALGTAAVTNGGNLRTEPRIVAETVIAQVCPNDQLAILQRQGDWVRVRVVSTAPDCVPNRAAGGTEGWLSVSLIAETGG
jgi:WD40 repeat protein